MKIAASGDIHCRVDTRGLIEDLFGEIQSIAEVLVLTGDLTDTGLVEEAEVLLEQLKELAIPVVATLGNHDHESGKANEIKHLLREGGVCILDGTVTEIGNVGFVGTKGFCGGFSEHMVQPFGEEALKSFIRTGIDEAITLENALAKLNECPRRVAVLHYAPIKETLEGESPEIYPFLGSSRLANALDRRGVNVIFHGHAHHGCPEGRTKGEIPVHNASRFVLMRHTGKPYCLVVV